MVDLILIYKLAKKKMREFLNSGKKIKIITVGSKGYDQLKKEFNELQLKRNLKIKKISFDDADLIEKNSRII